MAESGKEIDGSALCTQCAMCCHGVLHDWGHLKESEVEPMKALGLRIERTPDYLGFSQPCAAVRGTICSIYEHRPAACASYRCALLKRYMAGEIPIEMALPLVAEAKRLLARAQAVLPAKRSLRDVRTEWQAYLSGDKRPDWTKAERSERTGPFLAISLLNRFIDRHFRLPRETMMMSPEEAADRKSKVIAAKLAEKTPSAGG